MASSHRDIPPAPTEQVRRGLAVQARVVGALMMRELHTRYGRDNIGYLWMFAEPALLATAVAILHGFHPVAFAQGGIHPVPFAIVGYCTFIIFRGIVGRAEATIESNAPLLYHRRVTLFDMQLARSVLEGLGVGVTMFILLWFSALLGYSGPPARPLLLICGVIGYTWFSFNVSMLVCAGTYGNRIVEKIIHPSIYILMPLSGAFYMLEWISEPYRTWMSWFPITQFFEIVHAGQFETAKTEFIAPVYVGFWLLCTNFLGMIALRIVRRNVHLY